MPAHPPSMVVGHLADHHCVQVPLLEDRLQLGLTPALGDNQHPLLRFGKQNFIWGQPRFAQRHSIEIEFDSESAPIRHLARRRGESRRAHVLNRHDRAGPARFKARLDQQFLRERIADLHRRTLGLALFVELRRRHRRAMNSVAPGRRANVKHRIAGTARSRAHHLVLAHQAETERIDEDIFVVRRVEHYFARDCRHSHAIAVTADSADHAAEQVARSRMIERAELERVHARDRPRAHRKDVAQNSADSGRRALVRLDERRMVMAFDFENRRPSVADVDSAGILARPLHHQLAL